MDTKVFVTNITDDQSVETIPGSTIHYLICDRVWESSGRISLQQCVAFSEAEYESIMKDGHYLAEDHGKPAHKTRKPLTGRMYRAGVT